MRILRWLQNTVGERKAPFFEYLSKGAPEAPIDKKLSTSELFQKLCKNEIKCGIVVKPNNSMSILQWH